jgi:predicted GNAT family N-acyltransferase
MLDYSFHKAVPVSALQALFRQTSWAAHRTASDVALLIANTPVQLGAWHAELLVGYARALTDGRSRALIDDVIVAEAHRGSGIGGEIMRHLLARLAGVEEVYLLADDRNAAYYSRFGFVQSTANCLCRRNS